jgi:hypothetical protein
LGKEQIVDLFGAHAFMDVPHDARIADALDD